MLKKRLLVLAIIPFMISGCQMDENGDYGMESIELQDEAGDEDSRGITTQEPNTMRLNGDLEPQVMQKETVVRIKFSGGMDHGLIIDYGEPEMILFEGIMQFTTIPGDTIYFKINTDKPCIYPVALIEGVGWQLWTEMEVPNEKLVELTMKPERFE